MCICNYLYAAIYSGFIEIEDFKTCIFNLIEATPIEEIPYWALDLSLIYKKEDILCVLFEYSSKENYINENDYDIQSVILGYYYWMYNIKKESLDEFLKKSCAITDSIYDMININSNQNKNLDKDLYDFFSKYMMEAQRQFYLISSLLKR